MEKRNSLQRGSVNSLQDAMNNSIIPMGNGDSCKKIEGVPSPAGVPAPTAGELMLKEHLDQMNTILQNVFNELKNARTSKVTGASGTEGEGQWYVTGEVPVQVATPNPPVGSSLDPDQIAYDTLTNTFGPSSTGYQRERVRDVLKVRNAPRATVINDGDTTIQVISTVNGRKWSPETPILPYEARTFFNVWELRIRCTKAGDQTAFNTTGALKGGWYRVTEYDYWLSYSRIVTIGPPNVSINFTPLEFSSANITAGAGDPPNQPLAGTPILGAALTTTNAPSTIRINVAMDNSAVFSAVITNSVSGKTTIVNFNSGAGLIANALYEFDMLINTGDSVNFIYGATGGRILDLRVQEIDAAIGT